MCALSVLGCESLRAPSPYTLKPLNEAGYFNTKEIVDLVKVNERVDINAYKKMIYVKTKYEDNLLWKEFWLSSLSSIALFDTVIVGPSSLELLVLQEDLADKLPNVSNFIGLHKFQKIYGKFLIIDCDDVYRVQGGKYVKGNLRVIDPANGKLLLHLFKAKNIDWSKGALSEQMYYPLINGFIDWIHGRPIKSNEVGSE